MFEFMKGMSPTNPQSAYRLGAITAFVGTIGSVVARFFRLFVENMNREKLDPECTSAQLMNLIRRCINRRLSNRRKFLPQYRIMHLISLLFNVILCLPFFVMEDVYSEFETSSVMKDMLCFGVVMQVMSSAFHSGVRSASGLTSRQWLPRDTGAETYWYPGNLFSSMMLSSGFSWITFIRTLMYSAGIALACFYDLKTARIGPHFQLIGWAAAVLGLLVAVLDILRLTTWSYFQQTADYFLGIFWLVVNVWIFVFGWHCKKLYRPEDKEEASSGSEISDDEATGTAATMAEEVIEPITNDTPQEDGEKKKKKKKKKHHKPEEEAGKAVDEGSDDDI